MACLRWIAWPTHYTHTLTTLNWGMERNKAPFPFLFDRNTVCVRKFIVMLDLDLD